MRFQQLWTSFGKTPRLFQWGWLLVLLGSVALRFVGITDMAWGYDELSAVFRAMSTADKWHSHLAEGVAVDGHPAGVQTILWWWISVAGNDVLWPRIFTAIFSMGVLWQFHRIANKLFGYEAAFWSVCLMGLMWWQSSMAIWIRPYIFGLPFVLWSWDLVLGLLKQRDARGDVMLPEGMGWFAVKLGGALAGAAYIHYFAGLTAGASFLALLLIQPKIQANNSPHTQGLHPSYILFLPITVALLFYLPHLPITYAQFQLGGLGWLNQPKPEFLYNFLQYATGNSLPILILFVSAIVYAIQFQFRIAYLPKPASLKRILRQPVILLTLGFTFVFAFGYVFSVTRAPILQNNALYFAFPLLILVAGYGIATLRNQLSPTFNGINRFEKITRPLAIALPALLLYNTLYQKQFLTLERKGSHHRIVEKSIAFVLETDNNGTDKLGPRHNHIWLDGPTDNYQFHKGQILQKHKTTSIPPSEYFEHQGPSLPYLAKKLQSLKLNDHVFLGVQSGSQPWLSEEIDIDRKLSPSHQPTQEQLIGGEWFTLANYREPTFSAADFHLQNASTIHNTTDTTTVSAELPLNQFKPQPNDVILIVVKVADAQGEIQTSLWNPNKPDKHYTLLQASNTHCMRSNWPISPVGIPAQNFESTSMVPHNS
ncbi:MAG: hypothetical protein RLZZ47_1573 [Bacteroidota bacterium]